MRAQILSVLAVPLFILGAALPVRADVILMANGDRISGVVVEVSDGNLTIDTDYAGSLRIAWKKVNSVQTDEPVQIRLSDDSVVKGRFMGVENGKLKFQEEDQQAPREIPKDGVVQLKPPGVVWHGTVTLAAKAENGNSRSKDLFVRGELTVENENFRALVRGNYARETDDGVLSEDNFFFLLKGDYHLSLSSYAYISNEALRDRFEDLQFRDVTSVGLGYIFAKSDAIDVWTEAGPALMAEALSDGSKDIWFGGRVGVHVRVTLPLGLEIRDDLTYWPSFERWVNWQLHNELTLSSRIAHGIYVSLALITDIDNEPSVGREREDNKVLLGVSHKF